MISPEKYTDPIYQADMSENIGRRHDIHCWHEQAHTVCSVALVLIFS
jgi:hypothetical protein